MSFLKRLFFYGIGLTIGIIAVYFFMKKKGTQSFDYLPNARVLKNIRVKSRLFSNEAEQQMKVFDIDTSHISQILKKGDVDFKNSKIKVDSCKLYQIKGSINNKNIRLSILNCDSTAIISKIAIE